MRKGCFPPPGRALRRGCARSPEIFLNLVSVNAAFQCILRYFFIKLTCVSLHAKAGP